MANGYKQVASGLFYLTLFVYRRRKFFYYHIFISVFSWKALPDFLVCRLGLQEVSKVKMCMGQHCPCNTVLGRSGIFVVGDGLRNASCLFAIPRSQQVLTGSCQYRKCFGMLGEGSRELQGVFGRLMVPCLLVCSVE